MLKRTLTLACLTLSMGANAAIWDLDADTNERAGGQGTDGKEIWYDVGGGVANGDFRLSAFNYNAGSPYDDAVQIYAYLDNWASRGKDGGGACQDSTCSADPDDNLSRVTNNEMLGLELTTGDFIEGLTFWGDHQDYQPDGVLLDIDGVGEVHEFEYYAITFDTVGGAFVDLAGIATTQLFITTVDAAKSSELYLSAVYTAADRPAEVPLPAAAWLFGSALLGLGAVKRRKA